MLIGQYKSKLTEKYRISVPKRFREELGESLVIAKWYENCLVFVSYEGWQALLTRLVGTKKVVTSPVRDVDRFILGSAFEVKLDSQGRFVVPEILLTFAQIENEVVFVGLGDRVEIWASEKWDNLESVAEEKAAKAIELVAKENGKSSQLPGKQKKC